LAGELSGSGVVRYDLGARRLFDPGAVFRFVTLVRSKGFDLVHAHGQDAAIMGSWARRFTGFRLIVTRHVLEEPGDTWRQRWRARLALGALRRADGLVGVSHAAANRLTALASLETGKVRVITNGICLEQFDPHPNGGPRSLVRASLGFTGSDVLILVPAVLRPGKGHDVLLASVPRVLERFPKARFILAGDGELGDQLRAKAASLDEAVRFLGHRGDVPDLMDAADIVVLPSLSEALPTVALEAAAAGRAMVASNVGGVPEVVTDGVTGLLVPPGEPEALAEAVSALLADPDRMAALGSAGRHRALAEFGIDTQVRKTVELWEKVSRGGGPSA
jgi:glycosyltransferase involved in cell wall biosynthesis